MSKFVEANTYPLSKEQQKSKSNTLNCTFDSQEFITLRDMIFYVCTHDSYVTQLCIVAFKIL